MNKRYETDTMTPPKAFRAGKMKSIFATLALIGASLAGPASAAVTWQVQSDYFGERNSIAQPRTIRGMALSDDETSVYTGLIQSPNTGSTSLRKVRADVLAVPGTDHVIFGNGMPGGIGTFGQVGGQPVYAGGLTGTFEAWRDVGNSPEAIDTDDRGNVYVALQSGISGANQIIILSSDLATQLGVTLITAPVGVAIHQSGATYYLYTMSDFGLRRYDVTTVAAATLDLTWNPAVFNGRNLVVDADGTVFVTGNSQVRRVSADGTTVTHTASVPNAADVALFQDKIYIIKRQSPTQPIVVLNKADLTSGGPDIVVPALGGSRGDISQFTSIDVTSDGRLFVSEENYTGAISGSNSGALTAYTPPATSFNPTPGPITGRIYFDRVLVSTPLPDEVDPEISCAANQTAGNDPGECEADVTVVPPTATDDVDGPLTPTAARSDMQDVNDPYPVGTTTITWTATDSAGNSASCVQTVTVHDTEPPSITCPADVSEPNTPGQCSAVVNYTAPIVADNCPGVSAASCTPPSGSTFPKGTTLVNCTAQDAALNSASCSFNVTVNDTEAPNITCPANVSTTATGPGGAAVSFTPTVTDNCDTITPVCTPPSGSTFAIGTTPVNCTATDTSGNSDSCSFTVTVAGQPPRAAKTTIRDDLVIFLASISNPSDRNKIQDAIDHLTKSVTADKWIDDSHPKLGGKGEDVFKEEKAAVGHLKSLRNSNNSGTPASTYQTFINRIVAADRDIATIAINDAIARTGNPTKINNAQVHRTKGDNEAAADKPDKAIDEYKNAWKDATSA